MAQIRFKSTEEIFDELKDLGLKAIDKAVHETRIFYEQKILAIESSHRVNQIIIALLSLTLGVIIGYSLKFK